jgi:hypothetical protein
VTNWELLEVPLRHESLPKVLKFAEKDICFFTPLESPIIYGGDDIDKILIPYRKGGVKAPSFLTGFTG